MDGLCEASSLHSANPFLDGDPCTVEHYFLKLCSVSTHVITNEVNILMFLFVDKMFLTFEKASSTVVTVHMLIYQ